MTFFQGGGGGGGDHDLIDLGEGFMNLLTYLRGKVMTLPCHNFYQILDFGLGRGTAETMTGYVTTRYWRAPEVLLNWMHYDQKGTCC